MFTLEPDSRVVCLHCTTAGGVFITNFFHGATAPFIVIVNHKIVFSAIVALLIFNNSLLSIRLMG